MQLFDLDARFDSRKSFYGKAKVLIEEDGSKTLLSYNTPVAKIHADGTYEEFDAATCSLTTRRHVREFKRQFDID